MNRQETNPKEAKAVERFQMISELLKDDIDTAKMVQLKKKIAAENNLSVRTIERYCKAFREKGFSGLCPASKAGRTAVLPEGYDIGPVASDKKHSERTVIYTRAFPSAACLH